KEGLSCRRTLPEKRFRQEAKHGERAHPHDTGRLPGRRLADVIVIPYGTTDRRFQNTSERKTMDAKTDDTAGKCPFTGTRGPTNRHWWPEALDVSVLHRNSNLSDPMGEAFDYAKEFKSLDLNAVVKDLTALMTESQEWWPADFGHYGGLM